MLFVRVHFDTRTRRIESVPFFSRAVIELAGDSGSEQFWDYIIEKYPHVDIFLDDGGHFMKQQMMAMEKMLPHLQPEGVYVCEDINTSWAPYFGGRPNEDARNRKFLDKTYVGLVHKSLDWLNAGWFAGDVTKWQLPADDRYDELWWKVVPNQVKHIHYYNQIVVYEKGLVIHIPSMKTTGSSIPYRNSGVLKKTPWKNVLEELKTYTESPF